MKIIEKTASRERCAEAGWFAYDFVLDEKIDREFIYSLRPLGSFLFLPALKKPFFKIESDHFMIKGIEGEQYFRVAVHMDYPEELKRIEMLHGFKDESQGCPGSAYPV